MDIIQEIRKGNKDAVKAVYQKYAKDVYKFAKSITGDNDTALAATKKTFLKLFKNIQKGDNPTNLRTAALKIAYEEAGALAKNVAQPQDDNYDGGNYEPDDTYDEEVPVNVNKKQPREEIYMPKGGYDAMQVDDAPQDEYEEDYYEEEEPVERPARRPGKRSRRNENPQARYDEEAYDENNNLDVYNAFEEEEQPEEEYEEEKPRKKGLFIVCVIINIILIIILLWFLIGLLQNLGVLPSFDLGYQWFNNTIYPLF